MTKVNLSISKDLQYSINDRKIDAQMIESELSKSLLYTEEAVVVLHIDKEVPVEHLVRIAGIATKLKAKVSIAAKPE